MKTFFLYVKLAHFSYMFFLRHLNLLFWLARQSRIKIITSERCTMRSCEFMPCHKLLHSFYVSLYIVLHCQNDNGSFFSLNFPHSRLQWESLDCLLGDYRRFLILPEKITQIHVFTANNHNSCVLLMNELTLINNKIL